MTIDELKKLLRDMALSMEDSVESVNKSATNAQQKVFELLLKHIDLFDSSNGSFVPNQPLAHRFAKIQSEIEAIIGKMYQPALSGYFSSYSTVEDTALSLHKSFNNIEIAKSNFTAARQAIYTQAEYYLLNGLADAYIQPAKYLLMQQVATGGTIEKARSIITNWDKGELETGALASDRHAPRLQAYATQIARDTIYTYNGAIQDVIKERFNLTKFIYVGALVKDSRPFCRHLVNLNRKIDIKEIPKLVIAYPNGLRPDTTMANFIEVRGGFNCNHIAMPVK